MIQQNEEKKILWNYSWKIWTRFGGENLVEHCASACSELLFAAIYNGIDDNNTSCVRLYVGHCSAMGRAPATACLTIIITLLRPNLRPRQGGTCVRARSNGKNNKKKEACKLPTRVEIKSSAIFCEWFIVCDTAKFTSKLILISWPTLSHFKLYVVGYGERLLAYDFRIVSSVASVSRMEIRVMYGQWSRKSIFFSTHILFYDWNIRFNAFVMA